jgi:hypothetical protein
MYQIWVERQQENSSFANFGLVSVGAVCKCAVLRVGCSLHRFSFSVFIWQIVCCVGRPYTWR